MRSLLFYSPKPRSQVRILIYRNWAITALRFRPLELKGVTFVVDCVKCVPIPVKKQDDPLEWAAKNCMTHPLSRAQKLMNYSLSAPSQSLRSFYA